MAEQKTSSSLLLLRTVVLVLACLLWIERRLFGSANAWIAFGSAVARVLLVIRRKEEADGFVGLTLLLRLLSCVCGAGEASRG